MGMSFILCLLVSLPLFANIEKEFSAVRPLTKDYSHFERKALEREKDLKFLRTTPLGTARLYTGQNLPDAVAWKTMDDMQSRFEAIRDERFLVVSSEPEFPRRISWLYPHDGCWTRAALFNRNAFRMFVPVPSKVFAFGNLRVKTPNSTRGVVGWWYHVAPIVQVENTKYVLDPSIESKNPLTLDEWLTRMGNPKKIKVAICNSGTYSPGDNCGDETDGVEIRGEQAQKYYLGLEKKQLQRLGRNVQEELGDAPPWLK